MSTLNFNCTCSVMFVGGTSLYEITTTFWLKVAFIAFNSCFQFFFKASGVCCLLQTMQFPVHVLSLMSCFRFQRFIFTSYCGCYFLSLAPSPAVVAAWLRGHRWWPLRFHWKQFVGQVAQYSLLIQPGIQISLQSTIAIFLVFCMVICLV